MLKIKNLYAALKKAKPTNFIRSIVFGAFYVQVIAPIVKKVIGPLNFIHDFRHDNLIYFKLEALRLQNYRSAEDNCHWKNYLTSETQRLNQAEEAAYLPTLTLVCNCITLGAFLFIAYTAYKIDYKIITETQEDLNLHDQKKRDLIKAYIALDSKLGPDLAVQVLLFSDLNTPTVFRNGPDILEHPEQVFPPLEAPLNQIAQTIKKIRRNKVVRLS